KETGDASQVGKILSSTPGPGVDAPGRSQVAVVVGIAQTTVQVPDVSNQDPDSAEQQLTNSGFRVQRQDVDGTGQEGSVLGTNPPAGSRVQRNSQVVLQISRGNQIKVPNVVGDSLQDAARTLQQAGFSNINQDSVDVNNRKDDGNVVKQSIPAGSTANPNDDITITQGRYSGGGVFGNN
ncbi:MAG: eukaryotic-like serine/threonine-protein kinase, partial [Pseudonocardiales bacterium]|nr:eukaryotic-like serine/threonine-protein kinase [Pseudonocardiales bacterium]